jgi:hypothetical protein
MDEPPPLEDGSSYGRDDKEIQEDPHNLEERFYRYGVRPEWLQLHRILNHRYLYSIWHNSILQKKKLMKSDISRKKEMEKPEASHHRIWHP